MAPRKIEIAPRLVAEGKRLYEQTVTPVRTIADKMGISCTTLQARVDEWGWKRRDYHSNLMRALRAAEVAAENVRASDSVPAAQNTPSISAGQPPADRVAIAARMQQVVERQMDAVERVLAILGPANQIEAERTARTLASTARTLRDIAAFNQPDEMTAPDAADDDPVPRDIDAFRDALARRIEAFVAARRAADDGGVPDDGSEPELA